MNIKNETIKVEINTNKSIGNLTFKKIIGNNKKKKKLNGIIHANELVNIYSKIADPS